MKAPTMVRRATEDDRDDDESELDAEMQDEIEILRRWRMCQRYIQDRDEVGSAPDADDCADGGRMPSKARVVPVPSPVRWAVMQE